MMQRPAPGHSACSPAPNSMDSPAFAFCTAIPGRGHHTLFSGRTEQFQLPLPGATPCEALHSLARICLSSCTSQCSGVSHLDYVNHYTYLLLPGQLLAFYFFSSRESRDLLCLHFTEAFRGGSPDIQPCIHLEEGGMKFLLSVPRNANSTDTESRVSVGQHCCN